MRSRFVLAALALVLLSGASSSLSAPQASATRSFTLEAVAIACPASHVASDGICLAYNGILPGPTLEVNLLDEVDVTLVNHIATSLVSFPESATKTALLDAPVSFHVHGTALDVALDGMSHLMGPGFADSFAPPNGSFRYHFRAPYNGTWHYHDHVLGVDGNEGIARGLAGALVVRSGGDVRPDGILDVHAMENGPLVRAPTGLVAGQSFEALTIGLGDSPWMFTLKDPSGATLRTIHLGPGISEHVVVERAQRGAYTWRVENDYTGEVASGSVIIG